MSITQYTHTYDIDYNEISAIEQSVNYAKCDTPSVGFESYIAEEQALAEYLCPESTSDLFLEGLWGVSYIVQHFSLSIRYCDQTEDATCADLDYIKGIAAGNGFYLKFIDSYFDSEDFEDPIKEFLDASIFNYVSFGYSKEYDIYFSFNEIDDQDYYISPFSGSTSYNYLSRESMIQMLDVNEDSSYLAYFRFYLTNKKETSSRGSPNILDILGTVGGLSEVIAIFFGLIVNPIAERLYFYTINSSLFQVDTEKIQSKEHQIMDQ